MFYLRIAIGHLADVELCIGLCREDSLLSTDKQINP